MKKTLPIIIVAVVAILIGLLVAGSKVDHPKRLDKRITLREKDKIPYGVSAAKSFLPSLFPHAEVITEDRAPGSWVTLDNNAKHQAVVFFSSYFAPEDDELKSLMEFAEHGNYVLIVSTRFSTSVSTSFNFNSGAGLFDFADDHDSLRVRLQPPAFAPGKLYTYPGSRYDSYLASIDTGHTRVLGSNANGWPDFVGFDVGKGKIFLHTAPLAFTNYFILHKDNIDYYRGVMSVFPANIERVVWDEYYLNKIASNQEKEPNIYAVLMRYPGLKWGLLLGLFLLILILLLGSRRRQRKILPHPKPTNDSLDFVKTLGRLYYDRNDHQNLARKMAVYFLEHVRTVYRLSTQVLDDEFVQALHSKSGYPAEKINSILSKVRALNYGDGVTETGLAAFHQELELFYQNT